MATKKENPDRTYSKPAVRVSLVESGSRLDQAMKSLGDTATAAQREEFAAVEAAQRDLQPEIKKAAAARADLRVFETENTVRLKALRSVDFTAMRGHFHDPEGRFESTRNHTAARVAEVFQNISQSHDVLAKIESRVRSLRIDDLALRVWAEDRQRFPFLDRDALRPRVPTMIRVDVHRAVQRVAGLPTKLKEAENAVEVFAELTEKFLRLAGGKPKKSEATLRDPVEIERAKAADPHRPAQTKADANFSGYEADNVRPRFEID